MAGHDVQLLRRRDQLDRETLRRSNTVTYTTPPDTTAPSAPALSLTGVWPVRVAVAWTTSVDDTGGQVWYTLLVNGADYGADQIGFQSGWSSTARLSTTYHSRSRTRLFRQYDQSNVVTVTTPAVTDHTPPTTPTNLRFSPDTSSPELWLDWDPSTDDTDPQSQIRTTSTSTASRSTP